MTEKVAALEAVGLGKRYRRGWALRECSFSLPAERVIALVGPNGAGKSTLMALMAGILAPTTGSFSVLGEMNENRRPHPKLALLSQDKPLYKRFSVEEMLHFGRAMNGRWDDDYARRLIRECDIPLTARIGTLSGGQRTRVALALALGRRPGVLMLDEPLASLDPLARMEVMQTLMAEVVDTGITVLLSSHVIADIEDVCEHLLLLTDGRLQLTGRIDDLIAEHSIITGSTGDDDGWVPSPARVEIRRTQRQTTMLARVSGLRPPPGWTVDTPTLQELVLGYLRRDRRTQEIDDAPQEWGSVA